MSRHRAAAGDAARWPGAAASRLRVRFGALRSRRLPWCGIALLAAACATAPPGAAALLVDVQVRAAGSDAAWSPPLAHHPQIQRAHVGEVVVPGIWTVIVAWSATDTVWFAELRRQHLELLVTIDGEELLTDGRTGYVKDLGSRPAAEALLARLPVVEPSPE